MRGARIVEHSYALVHADIASKESCQVSERASSVVLRLSYKFNQVPTPSSLARR